MPLIVIEGERQVAINPAQIAAIQAHGEQQTLVFVVGAPLYVFPAPFEEAIVVINDAIAAENKK